MLVMGGGSSIGGSDDGGGVIEIVQLVYLMINVMQTQILASAGSDNTACNI